MQNEPKIKSSYDSGKETRRQQRRRGRLDYLWMIPLYLLQQAVKLTVRYPYILLAIVIIVMAGAFWHKFKSTSSVKEEETTHIAATANQIQRIREIEQWEALAIECEEMTDTFEQHFFGDKSLVRIYTGTLRIGVDMRHAPDDWFTAHGDTAVLKLPPVTLLNPDFIDEARTRTFSEKGTWNAAVNEVLYRKARSKMLRRSFGTEQREQAERNIAAKFESMFRAFGYKHVEIVPNEDKTHIKRQNDNIAKNQKNTEV